MRVLKVSALFLLFFSALLIPPPAQAMDERSELTVSFGRRTDNLDWNIAGPTPSLPPPFPARHFVNVLSELTWSDIESNEIKAVARVYLNRYFLKGMASYGFITDGSNQDSDFAENDRTFEFSRSNNSSDDGTVWDLSGAIGHQYGFPALGGKVELIPLLGISVHKQNLTISEGVQTVTYSTGPALGPFPGLNSTFDARWAGPWAGADIAYAAGKFKIFGSFEYHLVYYRAEANWNLRGDFSHPVSFEHWATGKGVVFSAGVEYNVSQQWSLTGGFNASDFQASDGTDRTYFFNGAVSDTPLNEVNWDSQSAFFGLNYRF